MQTSREVAKNKLRPTIPLVTTMIANRDRFARTLAELFGKLNGKNIAIWDTESDGVGGYWKLDKTREWFFLDFAGETTLHIRRTDAAYTDQGTADRIDAFLRQFDYLIAFEPGNCDRNRYSHQTN